MVKQAAEILALCFYWRICVCILLIYLQTFC